MKHKENLVVFSVVVLLMLRREQRQRQDVNSATQCLIYRLVSRKVKNINLYFVVKLKQYFVVFFVVVLLMLCREQRQGC